jgi:glycosyltransferase involved in cell wall biosynthesis
MAPSVSVILPCYNHQDYVQNALESVLAQTLADIEVIAIDDCSSDATAQILEGFDDSRLTLVRHEHNRGSAETINEGIRRSKAPYVAILNSDDLYHPERLAHCLEFARGNNAMLVGTDMELIDRSGEVVQDRASDWIDWYRELKQTYRLSGDLAAALIAGNLFITTSNFFVHRDLFDSIGPLADYRYVQDYEFLLRAIAAHPQRAHWLEEKLLSYRLHPSNTIRDDNLAPNRQTLEILTRWMPDLAAGERAAERLRLFETHVLKLAGYIESASADKVHTQWQADSANYRGILGDRDNTIQELSAEIRKRNQEVANAQTRASDLESALAAAKATISAFEASDNLLRSQINEINSMLEADRESIKLIRSSASYRLGHGLLQPLRWIQRHTDRLLKQPSKRLQ